MRAGDLISKKDWDIVQNHLSAMQEYAMTRNAGDTVVTILVEPVRSPAWRVAMVVGTVVDQRDTRARQWHESVAQAKRALRACGTEICTEKKKEG